MLKAPDKSRKKCTVLQNIKTILNTMQPSTLLFCQSSLNTVSSTVYLLSFEVCMLLAFIPQTYFPIFGYLLWTSNNSNSHELDLFSNYLEGLSYQESTVLVIIKHYSQGVKWSFRILIEGQNALTPMPVLCTSFTWQKAKTRVIRIKMIESSSARDQIASFLVEVETNTGYIRSKHV